MKKELHGFSPDQGFVGVANLIAFGCFLLGFVTFEIVIVWLAITGIYLLSRGVDNIIRLYLETLSSNREVIEVLNKIYLRRI